MSSNTPVPIDESAEGLMMGDIHSPQPPTGNAAHSNTRVRVNRSPVRVVASPGGASSTIVSGNTGNDTNEGDEAAAELARLAAEARMLRPSRGTPSSALNALNPALDENEVSPMADSSTTTSANGSSTTSVSSSRSNSSTNGSAQAGQERYSFAQFCQEEEMAISKCQNQIRSILSSAVDRELAVVGPIVTASLMQGKQPNTALDDGTTVTTHSATSATQDPPQPEDSGALDAVSIVTNVAQLMTSIGESIERERRRINASAVRQQQRLYLAAQGLHVGGTAKRAKSSAQAALAARKALAESSEFVDCLSTAVSLTAIAGGVASVDFIQKEIAISVLSEFAEVLAQRANAEANKNLSPDEQKKTLSAFSLKVKRDTEHTTSTTRSSAGGNKSAAAAATTSEVIYKVASSIEASSNVNISSVFQAAVAQLAGQTPDGEVLPSVSSLREAFASKLRLSAFASFVFGKDLLLLYKTLANQNGAPDQYVGTSIVAAKEQFFVLVAAVLLLNYAADLCLPNANNQSATTNGTQPQNRYVDVTAQAEESTDSTLASAISEASRAPQAKPSSLTPLPKPFFAGDSFYFLGCAVKALNHDFSPARIRGLVAKASGTSAPAIQSEWRLFSALQAAWLPYQVPSSLVSLGRRCLSRFEAQIDAQEKAAEGEEGGDDAEYGSLTMPSCIDTREDSDTIFIIVTPQYCAMQCLSLNEGNHGGAWQLLADTMNPTDCVEIGCPELKGHDTQISGAQAAQNSSSSSTSFLRGGNYGGASALPNSLMFSAVSVQAALIARGVAPSTANTSTNNTNQAPPIASSSWEGSIYLGEHTKTSAYVEAIRCHGGIAGCVQPEHLATLWLPLAQSMFYSKNQDIGAEEILMPCAANTWYGDLDADVAKLDKLQIIEHIIVTDRLAVPEAYLELGAMAGMGYRTTERKCPPTSANQPQDLSADNDNELDMSEKDRKQVAAAKEAFRAARNTTDGALLTLVDEQIALADEYLPEDDADMGAVGLHTAIDEYLKCNFSAAKANEFPALPAGATNAESGKVFQMLLSKAEELEVFRNAVGLKLRSIEEELVVVSFEPLAKKLKKAGVSGDTTQQPADSVADENKSQTATLPPASPVTNPTPLSLRKMDCFCLALSLDNRSVKTWIKLALGLEDKAMCRVKEEISLHESCSMICERLLALNELKRRAFGATQVATADAKKKWAETVPSLLSAMNALTAPNEEALSRARLLAYGNAAPQFTTFVPSIVRHDPLVYERTLFGLGGAAGGSDITVTRVEAVLRAISCDPKDSKVWFVLGSTLAERELFRDRCLREYRVAEAASKPESDLDTTNFSSGKAARVAYHKVKATNESVFALSIAVPMSIVPSGVFPSESADEMVKVGGKECFRIALKLSEGATAAASSRSMVAQWCKKNSYAL